MNENSQFHKTDSFASKIVVRVEDELYIVTRYFVNPKVNITFIVEIGVIKNYNFRVFRTKYLNVLINFEIIITLLLSRFTMANTNQRKK